ncbi:DUF3967 domain-containing protein [Niallia sp. 03091]
MLLKKIHPLILEGWIFSLLEVRELQETKKQLAATQKKKWWKLF